MDAPSPSRAATAPGSSYVLTRFVILRLLALVYAVAFLILVRQLDPLLGPDGCCPRPLPRARCARTSGSTRGRGARAADALLAGRLRRALHAAAWVGLGLSVAALLGATNALVQLALWALYLSFVQVGQLFYGYGWETQLSRPGSSPSSSARCAGSAVRDAPPPAS